MSKQTELGGGAAKATKETMPRHIWIHEVTMAAIGAGAAAEGIQELKAKLIMWYEAGEPVWMAASGIAQMVKSRAVHVRAEKEASNLRRIIRNGKC